MFLTSMVLGTDDNWQHGNFWRATTVFGIVVVCRPSVTNLCIVARG